MKKELRLFRLRGSRLFWRRGQSDEHLGRQEFRVEGAQRDEGEHFEGDGFTAKMPDDAVMGGFESGEVLLARLDGESIWHG